MEVSFDTVLDSIMAYGIEQTRFKSQMCHEREQFRQYAAKEEAAREIAFKLIELLPSDEQVLVRKKLKKRLTLLCELVFLNPEFLTGGAQCQTT